MTHHPWYGGSLWYVIKTKMATPLISAWYNQLRWWSPTTRASWISWTSKLELDKARDNFNKQMTLSWWLSTTQTAQDQLRNAQYNMGNVNRNATVDAFTPKYADPLATQYQTNTLWVVGPWYAEQQALRWESQQFFNKWQEDLNKARKAVQEGILANQATEEGIQAGIWTRAGLSSSAIWAAKQLATSDTSKQLAEAQQNYLTNRANAEQQYLSNIAAVNAANQNIDQQRQAANTGSYWQLAYAQNAAAGRAQSSALDAARKKFVEDLLKKTIPNPDVTPPVLSPILWPEEPKFSKKNYPNIPIWWLVWQYWVQWF